MLHIIFMILKITGILIGSILLLILLGLFCCIFVPVRYRSEGSYLGKARGYIRFSWLLSIVTVRFSYEEDGKKAVIKIFGIPLKKRPGKEKKERPGKNKKREDRGADSEGSGEAAKKRLKSLTQRQPEAQEEPERKKIPEEEALQEKNWKKKGIVYTFREFCDKIKQIPGKLKSIYDFFTNEENHKSWILVKSQLFIFIRHIKPRKLKVTLRFGFENPACTGQLLGFLCMFYPIYRHNIELKPDFEHKILEGNFYLKGRMRGIHFIRMLYKLWKDQNLRKAWNRAMS